MENIHVRTAERADIPRILELYAELQPSDPPIDEKAAVAVFESAASRGVTYFVAVCGARVVGTCYVAVIPNITKQCASIGFVENVITAADYRRNGVGRKLMSAAVDCAKAQGCYKVTLQSGIHRAEAHKFYESAGFDGGSKRAFEIRF